LYSLEAVRGFHRFDFSSLAAVAFFSVFLEPLRNSVRLWCGGSRQTYRCGQGSWYFQ